jgi:hypothetical protein
LIVESVRDIWEAVVIYEFLRLILAYCDGENACVQVIAKNPASISHMWPFNYCFPRLQLDSRFMRLTKRMTLQFVFIKPIMAAVNIAMFLNCMISNSIYQMTQLIVYNISYSVSLYGLLLFYFATHHHPSLATRRPIVKFLGIKLIIFATYYQGLMVQLVPGFDRHYLEALNNFIFCWEMIFFAILHVWAFGWFEFVGGSQGLGDQENPLSGPPGVVIGQASILHDYENPENNPKENALDAMKMNDIIDDAIENFDTRYERHVRLETTNNASSNNHDHSDDDEEANPFHQMSAQTNQVNDRPLEPVTKPAETKSNPFKNPWDDDLANI